MGGNIKYRTSRIRDGEMLLVTVTPVATMRGVEGAKTQQDAKSGKAAREVPEANPPGLVAWMLREWFGDYQI